MNNDRNTNCTDVAIKNNKKSMQKHLIYSLICIAIALISFFAISNWATSADTYSRIINTLNELQKKALELTGTATQHLQPEQLQYQEMQQLLLRISLLMLQVIW